MKYLGHKIVRMGILVTIIVLGVSIIIVKNAIKNMDHMNENKVVSASSSIKNNINTSLKNDEKSQQGAVETTQSAPLNENKQATKEREKTGPLDQYQNPKVSDSNESKDQNSNSTIQQINTSENIKTPVIEKEPSQNTSGKLSLTGYIIDEDCFTSYPNPAEETRDCLNMPECASSGYGIAVKEKGKYTFYFFDGEISEISQGNRVENATGGQQLAWKFIDEHISKNVQVTVTATLTGDKKTNPNKDTADEFYYPEIKVELISLG